MQHILTVPADIPYPSPRMPMEPKPEYRLGILAPLPSPIPTGKGSRSAANDTFPQYLEKSFQVPKLNPPESRSYSPSTHIDQVPSIVNLEWIISEDHDSIQELVKSSRDFGAFLISGHGISLEEVRSSLREAEHFLIAKYHNNDVEFEGEITEGENISREEILRGHFRESTIAWRTELVETEKCKGFSKCIEGVAYKLDHIAKEVLRVLLRAPGDQNELPTDQEWETTLGVYKCIRGNIASELDTSSQKGREADSRYTLRVVLPLEQYTELTLSSKTEGRPVVFHSKEDTVIVTCGKELEEWSHGDLKSAYSLAPDFQLGTSLLLEYECSLPRPYRALMRNDAWKLSVTDQVLIVLIIGCLVKFLGVWSWQV